MIRLIFALLCAGLGLGLAACASTPSGPPTLTPLWTARGFSNPESVALSADGRFFYVSNVSGEAGAKDGDGFISRVGRDGTMIERQWAKGLDAPKGLALRDGRLWVSDIDSVVELDAASGAILARHKVDGARFLNDLDFAPDGGVLVTDSGGARIYVLEDGAASVWLADELLSAVNGLLPEPGRLVVTTMAGRLLAVDWRTRAITTLAEGLGAADGVAALGGNAYLVSEWRGRLFHVTPDGAHSVVMDTRAAPVLINDFLLAGDTLVLPNWEPSTLSAYRVSR
jgi:sugar lactone lactonase YvrE